MQSVVIRWAMFLALALPMHSAWSASSDFNGDGKSDIVWRQASTGRAILYLMNGGSLLSSLELGGNTDWSAVATGDFNGDGKADILWRQASTGSVLQNLMSTGTVLASTVLGGNTDWVVAGVADFNGDGKSDILWRQVSTGRVILYLMNGGTLLGTFDLGGNTDWNPVATGDFNGDAKGDILWRQVSTGRVIMYLMNGGTVLTSFDLGGNTDWNPIATGDFNGDGKSDILWRQVSTGQVLMYLMSGGAPLSTTNLGGNVDWNAVATGDFNGDGKSDILWRQGSTGEVVLWPMNGATPLPSTAIGGNTDWEISGGVVTTQTAAIGGTVSGLAGAGLVLQNNGGDSVSIGANGAFTFSTPIASGAAYAVTVLTQPSGPSQTCSVTSGGSGTVTNANVTNVTVTCTTNSFTVGGTVTGLQGTGLVLRNGSTNLPISASGAFTFSTPIASGTAYAVTVLTQPSGPSQTCSVTSGGSGTATNANVTNVTVTCTTNSFTVGGTVTGLQGTGLVLRNNAGNNLTVSASGAFAFSLPIDSGAAYAVTVLTQPSGPSQTCSVTSGGSGTVTNANVTNVTVTCTTNSFTVGGTVTGLSGTGLVLRNNAGNNLTVSANGAFAFSLPLDSGAAYAVTVLTQPSGPSQTCSVTSGGSGTVTNANVTNVAVTCATNSFTVGGTVTGLQGTGLVLRNNAGNNLTVSASGAFAFSLPIASGTTYAVTVLTQPSGPSQTCSVANGSGTVGASNVSNVAVTCTTSTFTISGTVSGLAGTGLVLRNNAGNNLTVAANGTFIFSAPIASGAAYAVTVLTQPSGPSQTCSVANGSGTVGASNVSNVAVTCTTSTFTVSVTVSGLAGTGLVLRNNAGNNLTVAANGTFIFSAPIASGAAYAVTVLTQPSGPSQTCSVANGSGTVGASNVSNVAVTCTTSTFTISGTVSGLAGTGLVLRNNAGNNLTIAASGAFTFSTPIASGATYAVTVLTQPSGPSQTCSVTSGSGTVGNTNVTNVAVTCTTSTFTIGGTVSGLAGTGLVLRNNAGNNLTIAASGAFTFSTPIASGATYAVTVLTQPSGPSQTCSVTSGSGTVGNTNVTNVAVTCTTSTFTIGGTVSGLAGAGLVLRNNAGNNLTIAAGGAFTFSTPIASGATYAVTVLTQPSGPSQTCTVANGSGTVGASNVSNVAVTCTTSTFTISGTVSGLAGTGLVLRNNAGNNLTIAASGAFTFSTPIASGATYAVTVLTQPSGPSQTCSVTSGSGTVGNTNVTNVAVTCTTSTFTIGGTVSGLAGAGLVLRNNAGNNLTIAAGGAFTFSTPIASGATYAVTVLTQPSGPSQTCTVANGSGTVGASNVTNATVICATPFSIGTVTDPLATQQWHLRNTGQTAFSNSAGVAGIDINVEPVYSAFGFAGNGVTVAVVDSGLEISHEDLAANRVLGGSWNFKDGNTDPTNNVETTGDHGTSVGGLIAMARNTVGGIGVAPAARLKGFNLLSSFDTPNLLASLGGSASNPSSNDVFVFNQSYVFLSGPVVADFLLNADVENQYLFGVTTLRGGKGALYVKSAGNFFSSFNDPPASCGPANAAGLSCHNANFDPYNAIPYQIVVGAINASGIKSSYSTAGSAIWVSAPSNENAAPGMIATDQSGCTNGYSRTGVNTSSFNNGAAPNTSCNYTSTFGGTSAAAPVAAGVIALLLEANPSLTWRDVKHILASTARQIDAGRVAVNVALANGSYVAEPAWTTNAAGFRFHNWYGFGMVNASAAVNMARNNYTLLGALRSTGTISSPALSLSIPDNSVTGASHMLSVPSAPVQVVEAVQISVTATHPNTGDLGIELTSPSGTRSVLKNIRDGFGASDDLSGMVLLSNAFYGENVAGNWTIKVVDGSGTEIGTLTGWTITVFGR